MELYKELCPQSFAHGTTPTLTDKPPATGHLKPGSHGAEGNSRDKAGRDEIGPEGEDEEAVDEVVIDDVVIKVRVNEDELSWGEEEEELAGAGKELPADEREPCSASGGSGAGGSWSRSLTVSSSRSMERSDGYVGSRRKADGGEGIAVWPHEEMYEEVIEHLEGRSLKDTYWRGAATGVYEFQWPI
eukprot:762497-Hanusia_phi.AAC.1